MNYLPSKKFVVIFAAALFVVGGFFIANSKKTEKLSTTEPLPDNYAEILQKEPRDFFKDFDGDGLKDWEEEIFGTDPSNPDTNGNGVTDGEEFSTKKQYGELEKTDTGIFFGLKNTQESRSLNMTDSIFREAALRYSYVRNTSEDGQIDLETKGRLIDSLAQDFLQALPPDPYTQENITTTDEISQETLNAYIMSVLVAISKNREIYGDNPLDIIKEWQETQDGKDLEKLSYLKDAYENLAQELSVSRVPKGFVAIHLQLINSMAHISETLEKIEYAAIDPITSMLATSRYLHYQNKKQEAIGALTYYFNQATNSAEDKENQAL